MRERESGALGLPPTCEACLFDLDGVLTDTAGVHTRAWTSTFDAFLRERAEATGEAFVPFDPDRDYLDHVDGRPRQDGVREFLRSRGIELPEGDPGDGPEQDTVWGVGNRKNAEFQRTLREDGVTVFEGSRRYLEAVRSAGLGVAVVSSSANTADVLAVTGLARYVQHRVDGVTLREEGIAGKPAPDSFLRAADLLGVTAATSAVFEDALSGVQAGRAGGFGCVVGVDRAGHGEALRREGADVVVQDLGDLL